MAFEKVDGHWVDHFANIHALSSGEMRFFLTDFTGGQKFSVRGDVGYEGEAFWGKAFGIGWSNGEYYENNFGFELDEDGQWRLKTYAEAGQSGMIEIEHSKDGKRATFYFLEQSKDKTRFEFPFDSNLKEYKFRELPRTPEQATQPDALPPQIPFGWLTAQEVPLEGKENIPVYTSNHDKPYRAAKGKAALGPRGWVQVFGVEGDYALVQYAISAKQYRIGYIDKKHLPSWYEPLILNFKSTPATVEIASPATDDPINSKNTLFTLKKGQQVILLSKMGDMAYFETWVGKQIARAFAPLHIFFADPQPQAGKKAMMTKVGGEMHEVMLTHTQLKPFPYAMYVDLNLFYFTDTPESTAIYPKNKPFQEEAGIVLRPGGKAELDQLERSLTEQGYARDAWDWPLPFDQLPTHMQDTYLLLMVKGNQALYALTLIDLPTPLLIIIDTPANLMQTWGQHLFDMVSTLELVR